MKDQRLMNMVVLRMNRVDGTSWNKTGPVMAGYCDVVDRCDCSLAETLRVENDRIKIKIQISH